MTKGKALLEARRILGPSAHVRYRAGMPCPCVVGTFDERGWRGVAVGISWGSALGLAAKHDAANDWKNAQASATAKIAEAKASLSATITRILERAKGKLTIMDLVRDMRKAA